MQGLDFTALLLSLVQVAKNAVRLEGVLHCSESIHHGFGAVHNSVRVAPNGVDLLVVVGDARNHVLPCISSCKTLPELGVVREASV